MKILIFVYIFISLALVGVFFWLYVIGRDLKGRLVDYSKTEFLFSLLIGVLWPLVVIIALPYAVYEELKKYRNKSIELDFNERLNRFNNVLKVISGDAVNSINSRETEEFITVFKGLNEAEKRLPFSFHRLNFDDEFQTIQFKLRSSEIGKNEGGISNLLLDDLFLSDEELLERELRRQQNVAEADLGVVFRIVPEQGESWGGVFCKEFNKAIKNLDRTMKARVKEAIHEISLSPITPKGDTIKKLAHIKDHWRYRIGAYRLLYLPDVENRKILFLKFDSRGEVYD
jgi:mRNA-degrading endonuclease RelE of RelBE toxin-antitoxin system